MHQLLALEGVFDPFGAGVEIGCSPGDHRSCTKDRGNVIEDRVRTLQALGIRTGGQRLVGRPHRVLQIFQDLGQLETSEALGIEIRDAVRPVETREGLHGYAPKVIHRKAGTVETAGEIAHSTSIGTLRIDSEMIQLLVHQLVNSLAIRRISERAQPGGRLEIGSSAGHDLPPATMENTSVILAALSYLRMQA